jgi:hypothetical protein
MNARGLKFFDVVIIALVLGIAVVSGFYVYGNGNAKLRLSVEAPGGTWLYNLDTDRTVEIPGALGDTTVEIAHGTAHIGASPCPNKTCVAEAPISKKGEWTACLPNRVIIRIIGNDAEDDTVDIIAH